VWTPRRHALPVRSNTFCKIPLVCPVTLPASSAPTVLIARSAHRGSGWWTISVSLAVSTAQSATPHPVAYVNPDTTSVRIAVTVHLVSTGTAILGSVSCVQSVVPAAMPLVPVFPVGKIISILIVHVSFNFLPPPTPLILSRTVASLRTR